jgi:hypothetical protein
MQGGAGDQAAAKRVTGGGAEISSVVLWSRDGYLICGGLDSLAGIDALAEAGSAAWGHPYAPSRPRSWGAEPSDADRIRALPVIPGRQLCMSPMEVRLLRDMHLEGEELAATLLAAFGRARSECLVYRFPSRELTRRPAVRGPTSTLALQVLGALPDDADDVGLWEAALRGMPDDGGGLVAAALAHPNPRVRVLMYNDASAAQALSVDEVAVLDSSRQATFARRVDVTAEQLDVLVAAAAADVRLIVAAIARPLSGSQVARLMIDDDPRVRRALIDRSDLTREDLYRLALDSQPGVSDAALRDDRMTAEILLRLIAAPQFSQRQRLVHDQRLSFHQIASSSVGRNDRSIRQALAHRCDAPREYVVRHAPASDVRLPPEVVGDRLRADPQAVTSVPQRDDLDNDQMGQLMMAIWRQEPNRYERAELLQSPWMPLAEVLAVLGSADTDPDLVAAALAHPRVPVDLVTARLVDRDPFIRWAALRAVHGRSIKASRAQLLAARSKPLRLRPRPGVDILEVPTEDIARLTADLLSDAGYPVDGEQKARLDKLLGHSRAEEDDLGSLALSVARCSQVPLARERPSHPCHTIVGSQDADPSRWQLPEPWAGNLATGRVVLLSSNPSIDQPEHHENPMEAEDYPRGNWPDPKVIDFMTRRFDPAAGWATADGHLRRLDGQLSTGAVRFWNNVRRRVSELLDEVADPARDYVMTEVVHCKSRSEIGVRPAVTHCASLHLDRILARSPAPLVVVLGAKARDHTSALWQLPDGFGTTDTVGRNERANMAIRVLGGHHRLITYLWHPTGMTAPKTSLEATPTTSRP